VLRPKGVVLHYEVELGLVMGKTVRDLDPEDHAGAMDAIDSAFIPPSPQLLCVLRTVRGADQADGRKATSSQLT